MFATAVPEGEDLPPPTTPENKGLSAEQTRMKPEKTMLVQQKIDSWQVGLVS